MKHQPQFAGMESNRRLTKHEILPLIYALRVRIAALTKIK